jgi:hypothetical protein
MGNKQISESIGDINVSKRNPNEAMNNEFHSPRGIKAAHNKSLSSHPRVHGKRVNESYNHQVDSNKTRATLIP